MNVRYEPGEERTEEETITKEKIEGTDDVATLLKWLDLMEGQKSDMLASVEARKLTETDDDEWSYRVSDAIGYVSMGIKRIKRKLRNVGVNPEPMTPDDKMALERARGAARFATFLLKAMGERLDPAVVSEIRAAATDAALLDGAAA